MMASRQNAPLINLQTNRLPIGPKLEQVIHQATASISGASVRADGSNSRDDVTGVRVIRAGLIRDADVGEALAQEVMTGNTQTKTCDAEADEALVRQSLAVPVLHTTQRLQRALQCVQEQQEPDDFRTQLQHKAASPATRARIRKKVGGALNHAEGSPLYKELVAADPSESCLAERLQRDLAIRDYKIRHVTREKVRGPDLNEWFSPDDYISSMPHCGLHDTLPHASCAAAPRILTAEELCSGGGMFLPPL